MLKYTFFIIVLFGFKVKVFESQSTNATSRCSLPGFVPTNCYNSCSEPTCANLRLGEDRICLQSCENGANCQCGGGLYRNDCDQCVSRSQCSVPCTTSPPTTTTSPVVCSGSGEVLTDCYNSCSEPTCANLRLGDRVCTRECQSSGKCQCGNGLYKNDCGVCVSRQQCNVPCTNGTMTTVTALPLTTTTPSVMCCKKDYVPTDCYNSCTEPTCANLRLGENRVCLAVCEISGKCQCGNGLYKNDCGVCVPKEQCGAPCRTYQCDGVNEELKTIELPPVCNIPIPIPKSKPCRKKYCRNHSKKHLKKHLKKHSCKNHKCKRSKCKKSKCNRSIRRQTPQASMRLGCQRQFTTKCECINGYARNNCEECVPADQANIMGPCTCTNQCSSDPNKEIICANGCNARTCENFYKLPYTTCSLECSNGCYCSATKDLWHNGTACVPSSMCPPQSQMNPSGNFGG